MAIALIVAIVFNALALIFYALLLGYCSRDYKHSAASLIAFIILFAVSALNIVCMSISLYNMGA